jgi:hypothetical protein
VSDRDPWIAALDASEAQRKIDELLARVRVLEEENERLMLEARHREQASRIAGGRPCLPAWWKEMQRWAGEVRVRSWSNMTPEAASPDLEPVRDHVEMGLGGWRDGRRMLAFGQDFLDIEAMLAEAATWRARALAYAGVTP